MELIVLSIIVVFLSLLGITSLIEWVASWIGGRSVNCERITFLPVKSADVELEQKLRAAYNSIGWDRFLPGGTLLLINMDADDEAMSICEAFAGERPDVKIISETELGQAAEKDSVYKIIHSILY